MKDRRQIRWHPSVIRLCLHLKYKSSSAYESMRNSGVLVLPSQRTLRDYTHWYKKASGFCPEVNKQLLAEANIKEEKDRYVVLSFDEIKIREKLVFGKTTLSLIGFTDLGDMNNSLEDIERKCGLTEDETSSSVGTHMLAFMVRGLFTGLEFPYAHFPTQGCTGEELFPSFGKL